MGENGCAAFTLISRIGCCKDNQCYKKKENVNDKHKPCWG